MRFQFWILFRSSNKMCVPKSNSSYRVPIQSLTDDDDDDYDKQQHNRTRRVVFGFSLSGLLSLFLWSLFCVYFFWVGSVLRHTRNSADLDRIGAMQLRAECAWRTYANRTNRNWERERERVLTTWAVTRQRERESAGTQVCDWVECDAHSLPPSLWGLSV